MMKRDTLSPPIAGLAITLIFYVLLLLLLVAIPVTSPADIHSPVASEPPPPGTVTDDLGRTVCIKKVPQRIISLAPSNTEILFALGLGEKIVGVTEFCNYPSEALDKEKVGGYSTPDIEKIIALQPDLILAASIHKKEVIPKLERRDLTVFAVTPDNLNGILDDISKVGKITGKEREASKLVAGMRNRIKAVTDKTQKLQKKPRVFYITWHDPLWSVGSDTLFQELIEKAGGTNIFRDIVGHKTVDLETVIGRNPQVVIACTGHGEAKDKPFEWAKAEPRLKATEACQNNRIYQIDADLPSRPGPRIVDALEKFAKFIHPEVFVEAKGDN